tara:strand:+ start:857 stop:1249 length:393 start_codon:yes stop_codon:yes gene_type:complete
MATCNTSSLSVDLDISQQVNVTCRKGDSFDLQFTVKNSSGALIDLTSYTFNMQVRTSDNASSPTIQTTGDVATGFKITGTASGVVTVESSASFMQNISAATYVYDLVATVSTTVQTWFFGTFVVNQDITQ